MAGLPSLSSGAFGLPMASLSVLYRAYLQTQEPPTGGSIHAGGKFGETHFFEILASLEGSAVAGRSRGNVKQHHQKTGAVKSSMGAVLQEIGPRPRAGVVA